MKVVNVHINLSLQSGPIYEQLKNQIRAQIFSGELKAGEMLPSIRTLAKELTIGIITAKRAYDDLIDEGYLYAVQGKGVFVAFRKEEELTNRKLEHLRKLLETAENYARENCISKEQFDTLLQQIAEERNEQS